MFKLKITDRQGAELKEGDIVAISDRASFKFYAEVKYLEEQQVLAPFHTFSFHSFEKIEKVPDGATLSSETRYKVWYDMNPVNDYKSRDFEGYLMSWRQCEHLLTTCYHIIKD